MFDYLIHLFTGDVVNPPEIKQDSKQIPPQSQEDLKTSQQINKIPHPEEKKLPKNVTISPKEPEKLDETMGKVAAPIIKKEATEEDILFSDLNFSDLNIDNIIEKEVPEKEVKIEPQLKKAEAPPGFEGFTFGEDQKNVKKDVPINDSVKPKQIEEDTQLFQQVEDEKQLPEGPWHDVEEPIEIPGNILGDQRIISETFARDQRISTQQQLENMLRDCSSRLKEGQSLKIRSVLDNQNGEYLLETYALPHDATKLGHKIKCDYQIYVVDTLGKPVTPAPLNVILKGEIFSSASDPHQALVTAAEYKKMITNLALSNALGPQHASALRNEDDEALSQYDCNQLRTTRSFKIDFAKSPGGEVTGLNGMRSDAISTPITFAGRKPEYYLDAQRNRLKGADTQNTQISQRMMFKTKEEMLMHAKVRVNDKVVQLPQVANNLVQHLGKQEDEIDNIKKEMDKSKGKFEEVKRKSNWFKPDTEVIEETDAFKQIVKDNNGLTVAGIQKGIRQLDKKSKKLAEENVWLKGLAEKLRDSALIDTPDLKKLTNMFPIAEKISMDPDHVVTLQEIEDTNNLLTEIKNKWTQNEKDIGLQKQEVIRLQNQLPINQEFENKQQEFVKEIQQIHTLQGRLEDKKNYLLKLKNEVINDPNVGKKEEVLKQITDQIEKIDEEIMSAKEFSDKNLKKLGKEVIPNIPTQIDLGDNPVFSLDE